MTTEELLNALARLRVETGSLSCLGCGHEHNCGVHGCHILRETAALIEDQTTTIRGLRFRLTGYHMEDSFNRGLLTAESQRRRKAEAERDAAIVDLKIFAGCDACRHCCAHRRDPQESLLLTCCDCAKKQNCKCASCGLGRTNWEWRGLPGASEGGEKRCRL